MDNFSDRLTLEGAGGQTGDTRSTFRLRTRKFPMGNFFGANTQKILARSAFRKKIKKKLNIFWTLFWSPEVG